MSRMHSTKEKITEAKRASTLEIMVRFEHEHELLSRLALVITGGHRSRGTIGRQGTRTGHERNESLPVPQAAHGVA